MNRIFLFFAASAIVASCSGAAKQDEMTSAQLLKLIKKGEAVQIVDKIITGDLDFTTVGKQFVANGGLVQNEVDVNIFFNRCIFMGKVTACGKLEKAATATVFRNNVVFMGCDFRAELDFSQAVVFGMFNFSQSVFRENATFNNMSVWTRDSYFSEVSSEKAFTLINTSFAGNCRCLNAKFGGATSFQGVRVNGNFEFNHSSFAGRSDFSRIRINGDAYFVHSAFNQATDFSNAQFIGNTDFSKAVFGDRRSFEKVFFLTPAKFDEEKAVEEQKNE